MSEDISMYADPDATYTRIRLNLEEFVTKHPDWLLELQTFPGGFNHIYLTNPGRTFVLTFYFTGEQLIRVSPVVPDEDLPYPVPRAWEALQRGDRGAFLEALPPDLRAIQKAIAEMPDIPVIEVDLTIWIEEN